MPKIIIKKSDLIVKKISVPEDLLAFTVGSEQGNDIIIDDENVSFFHLQFEKQNSEYYVRDLQSQLGTYVNGKKISNRTHIINNDEIGLGNHKITFLLPQEVRKPALVENYESESAASTQEPELEDRIASVPALMHLNSWLNDEQGIIGKKEPFLDKSKENGESASEGTQDPLIGESLQDAFDNNHDNSTVENFVEPSPDSYVSELNLGQTDEVIDDQETSPSAPETGAPEIEFEEPEKAQSQTDTFYLLGIYGYYLGRKFRIKPPKTRIGRDNKLNDIVIKKNSKGKTDQSVSRRHATILFKNNKLYLLDRRSKSRTWLNKKKLEKDDVARIKPGDEIEIISDKKSHIFRLVEEGDWNFSFPKKAGAWHIRNWMKILNGGTALLVMLACLVLARSFLIRNYIVEQPDPLTLRENAWSSKLVDMSSNGTDESAFSVLPAIADLNDDQYLDLIFADQSGALKAINGKTRETLWAIKEFQATAGVPVTIEDLFNSGHPNVIVISQDSRVRVIDGSWGIEIWKSPILAGPLTGAPVVADLNGDGLKDLAVASAERALYIGYSNLQGPGWVKLDLDFPIRSVASAANVTGNGMANLLLGTETGQVILVDGVQQTINRIIDINEEFTKATGRFDQNNPIRFPIALADLDGDAISDLLVSTAPGNIMALNGRNMERMWFDLSDFDGNFGDNIKQSVAVGDLDGDGLHDIAALTPEGRLKALKGTGEAKDRKMQLWEQPKQFSDTFSGAPVLVDFDKNGTMDVLATGDSGKMYIFEGASGTVLWSGGIQNQKTKSLPLVGDFDKDNYVDIMVLKSDGRFYSFNTNSLCLAGTIAWGQMYGNSKHTSASVMIKEDAGVHYLYMGLSLIVIGSVFGFNILIRKRRKALREHYG